MAIVVALVGIAAIAALWTARGFNAGMIVVLLIAFVYIIRILVPSLYNRVVVTDEGLDFRQIGYRIYTTWGNIEQMAYAKFGFAEGDILVLCEPIVKVNRWAAFFDKDIRLLEQNKKFAPLGKAIPLFLLNPRWRTGEPGREIQRHVPHLFVAYEK